MSHDLLRVQANERVDLTDFQFLADEAMQSQARQLGATILTDPAKLRSWIVSGFEQSNPAGAQVQVDKGVAILAQREGAEVYYGAVTSEGDTSKVVDMAAFGDGAYAVYVRFEMVDGASASRIFWNPAGSGSETAATISTRRQANWSVRIENSSPGAEWLQIASVVKTGGSVVITDERDLYFEGQVDSSYASGWGAGNDRNDDRQQYGVFDFQTFNAATRERLTEIVGEPWYRANRCGSDLIHKMVASDIYREDTFINGYGAVQTGGLGVDVSPGTAYVDGVRVVLSDATGGVASLTLPDNSSGVIQLLADGTIEAIAGAATGLELHSFTTLAGSITVFTDQRLIQRRLQTGSINMQNGEALQWVNSANNAFAGDLYLDASDDMIADMGAGNSYQFWDHTHANKSVEIENAGLVTLFGATPMLNLYETDTTDMWIVGANASNFWVAFNDTLNPSRHLWVTEYGVGVNLAPDSTYPFQVADSGGTLRRMRLQAPVTDPSPTILELFPKGASQKTAFRAVDDGGTRYFEWSYQEGVDYGYSTWRGGVSGASPLIRLLEDNGSGRTPAIMSGGVWIHGTIETTSGGARDNIANALITNQPNAFAITSNADSDTPIFRILRGATPDSSGALDFIVSNTYGNIIQSRAKPLHVGTYANANLFLKTNNTDYWELNTGGDFIPSYDISQDIGSTGKRISTIFANQLTYHAASTTALTYTRSNSFGGSGLVLNTNSGSTTFTYFFPGGIAFTPVSSPTLPTTHACIWSDGSKIYARIGTTNYQIAP